MDSTPIPSAADVRSALAPLSSKQLLRLAELSGVPVTTIDKVRRGETSNPGIETVRKFLPHIDTAKLGPQGTDTERAA